VRASHLFVALALFFASTAIFLLNTAGHALHDGDEAIYAEFAREMAASGDPIDLRWQGEVQIVRPPMTAWILTLARVFVPDERSVRWPNAAAAGAQVSLVFLLGFALALVDDRRRRWLAGLGAAAALATADLFVGYARYLESEPFLLVFVLAAWLAWEHARTRPRLIYAWGALAGAAMMTKQLVGALPLALPLFELVPEAGGERPRIVARRWLRGLAVTALVWLPWHVWELARHGLAFLSGYVGRNVIERSQAPMLHVTRPTFYLRELWRSEGAFAIAFAVALGCTIVTAVRRRRRADLALVGFTLVPLVVFSIAATRHDYYLLLMYPMLALMAGGALAQLPMKAAVPLVAAWAIVAGALHLPRNLKHFDGEDELRGLLQTANVQVVPRLYSFNLHVYAMRYYLDSRIEVRLLLESQDDLRAAEWMKRVGLPAPVELAQDLPAALAARPRPWLLVMPRARNELVRDVRLGRLGETRHYVLYRGD
jgi:4-amino-4-deoxy-L-arabinose transferase-like glycosyltransferase